MKLSQLIRVTFTFFNNGGVDKLFKNLDKTITKLESFADKAEVAVKKTADEIAYMEKKAEEVKAQADRAKAAANNIKNLIVKGE